MNFEQRKAQVALRHALRDLSEYDYDPTLNRIPELQERAVTKQNQIISAVVRRSGLGRKEVTQMFIDHLREVRAKRRR